MGSSKKNFAIIAIIVGAAGIGIGAYSIVTVGSTLQGENMVISKSPIELHPLALNGSPLLGSPDAPITMVEYGDYQCPNCMRFATQVKPMIVQEYVDSGKVKIVFKDFIVFGDDSVSGAIAAHCAGEQGRFWEMHDRMYANQGAINSGWINAESIRQFASDVGLGMQQFNSCLDSGKYADRVTANSNDGLAAGVNGTPTFLIIGSNGEVVTVKGAQPFDAFKQVFDDMLEG